LLVHPTKPNDATTLWAELRQLLAFEIASGGQVSIVNRLDRETSGIVLVAKTAELARKFGLLMQARRIHKEYHARCLGLATVGFDPGRRTDYSPARGYLVSDPSETND